MIEAEADLGLANGRNWSKLPPDVQHVMATNINALAEDQRADRATSDSKMRIILEGQRMNCNETDAKAFRQVLIKSGFDDKWKQKYRAAACSVLENYAGASGT